MWEKFLPGVHLNNLLEDHTAGFSLAHFQIYQRPSNDWLPRSHFIRPGLLFFVCMGPTCSTLKRISSLLPLHFIIIFLSNADMSPQSMSVQCESPTSSLPSTPQKHAGPSIWRWCGESEVMGNSKPVKAIQRKKRSHLCCPSHCPWYMYNYWPLFHLVVYLGNRVRFCQSLVSIPTLVKIK